MTSQADHLRKENKKPLGRSQYMLEWGCQANRDKYFCLVLGLQLREEANLVDVEFEAEGDMSLVTLQDPMASSLCYIVQSKGVKTETPVSCSYKCEDHDRCLKGVLTFPFDFGKVPKDCALQFTFGLSGYSAVMIRGEAIGSVAQKHKSDVAVDAKPDAQTVAAEKADVERQAVPQKHSFDAAVDEKPVAQTGLVEKVVVERQAVAQKHKIDVTGDEEAVARTVVVEKVVVENQALCTSRKPLVGDRVASKDGQIRKATNVVGNAGAWELMPQHIATVIAVNDDGDFRLCTPCGLESGLFLRRNLYVYMEEEKEEAPTSEAEDWKLLDMKCGICACAAPKMVETRSGDVLDVKTTHGESVPSLRDALDVEDFQMCKVCCMLCCPSCLRSLQNLTAVLCCPSCVGPSVVCKNLLCKDSL